MRGFLRHRPIQGSYIYGINGENTPSFNVDGSTGYYAFWNGNHKNYRYSMEPNAISSASGNQEKPYQPALRGTTVAKIDRKIDDGRGGNGVLKVSTGTGGACSYTSKDIVCRMTIYEWR